MDAKRVRIAGISAKTWYAFLQLSFVGANHILCIPMHLLGKENPSFHLKNIQTKETKEIKSVAMHSDEFTKTEKGKVLHLKELSLKIKEDKSPR